MGKTKPRNKPIEEMFLIVSISPFLICSTVGLAMLIQGNILGAVTIAVVHMVIQALILSYVWIDRLAQENGIGPYRGRHTERRAASPPPMRPAKG